MRMESRSEILRNTETSILVSFVVFSEAIRPNYILNKAVTRNVDRFPGDFMFRLTKEEFDNLRFQFGTSSSWGDRRHPPRAFTEQGVAMLSSVLKSRQAAMVNVEIMRAFVRLRQLLATHEDLASKLKSLERKYDRQFKVVFDAIRELMAPPNPPRKRRIGFDTVRGD